MRAPPRDCPCHSGLRYTACCGPLHAGAKEADTPEALMRSRYAAFAMGLGTYLVQTLASSHPDLASEPKELAILLSRARERQRFLGLRILYTHASSDEGEVLFFARIFERGADRSFAELSTFVREDGTWRYQSGLLVPAARLPPSLDELTREAFLELGRANEG